MLAALHTRGCAGLTWTMKNEVRKQPSEKENWILLDEMNGFMEKNVSICTLDFRSNGSFVIYTLLDDGRAASFSRPLNRLVKSLVVMIQQKEPSCIVSSRNRWF